MVNDGFIIPVTLEGEAVISCPKCEEIKTINVLKFKGKKYFIKIKCTCRHVFTIAIDFRRHYRKKIMLDGTYLNLEGYYKKVSAGKQSVHKKGKQIRINCHITDLSCEGVQLRAFPPHKIEVGNRLLLHFSLDNKKETDIEKTCRVRTVRENIIGGEFDSPITDNKDVGYYLLV